MKNKKGLNIVLTAGIIAGAADALAAVLVYAKPVNLHNAAAIFRYIASGLLGARAFQPGIFHPLTGLVLHFFIAFAGRHFTGSCLAGFSIPGDSCLKSWFLQV